MESAEVVALLQKQKGILSVRAFAKTVGVSGAYLWDVLNGHRPPGTKILAFLGLEGQKTVQVQRVYRRKRK